MPNWPIWLQEAQVQDLFSGSQISLVHGEGQGGLEDSECQLCSLLRPQLQDRGGYNSRLQGS